MPLKDEEYSCLWLKPFSSTILRMKFIKKIRSGVAGYIFKVRINGLTYALKIVSETSHMCNL